MIRPEFDIVPFEFEAPRPFLRADPRRGSGPARSPRTPPPGRPQPRSPATRLDRGAGPCVCPAHGTEFIRWVQSTLNRVGAARLPVDGVMDAASRNALRAFQRKKGLPVDGIAGPDTEQALREARRSGQTPTGPAPDAGEVYEFDTLELESPSSLPVLRRGSRGSAVTDLQRRLAAAGHSPGAADGIFGALTDAAARTFQRGRGLAVDGIVGAQTWDALLGDPPGTGAPAAPPTPVPAPGKLPAAWRNGPVNPPAWRPALRSHSSIECGSRDIPAHLQPESVSQGWTARTQRVASVIGGPLFNWTRNVNGRADRSVRQPSSNHYCGRAIDAFPPGVLYGDAAVGSGLRDGWLLANWAAHNAAAQNVSEVIFYDRIWTVARSAEGWRPYVNSSGTGNSLQHRDHVHISVY